jgi:hypothetical protein
MLPRGVLPGVESAVTSKQVALPASGRSCDCDIKASRDRVEGRFRFVPLDTRVLNPKVGVPAPTQLVILPTARNWQPKVELLILPFPLRCRISSSCRPFGLVLYRGRVALSGDGTVEFQAKDLNLLGTLAKIHRRYLKSRRRLILGILNRAHMVFTRSKTT